MRDSEAQFTDTRTASLDTQLASEAEVERVRTISVGWLRRLAPPLAVFLIARAQLWHSAAVLAVVESDPRNPAVWGRWDTALYFTIANEGYSFGECGAGPSAHPTNPCGNTAWLPGYPLLLRALVHFGVEINIAGVWLSAAFAIGTLLILWNVFLESKLTPVHALTLLLAGVFPGFIYYHAIFPVSLCLFCLVVALACYQRRHFVWAGLAGACAAFSYSSGMFIAAVFGLHLLVTERHQRFPQQVRQWFATSGITMLGFGVFLVMLQITVGNWQAYFMKQRTYGYDPDWPWLALVSKAEQVFLNGNQHFWDAQSLFVAVLAGTLLIAAARTGRQSIDGFLALFVVIYWLVPLSMGGQLSIYRAESMLLPGVILARRLSVPVLILLLLFEVYIGATMGKLFFSNALV